MNDNDQMTWEERIQAGREERREDARLAAVLLGLSNEAGGAMAAAVDLEPGIYIDGLAHFTGAGMREDAERAVMMLPRIAHGSDYEREAREFHSAAVRFAREGRTEDAAHFLDKAQAEITNADQRRAEARAGKDEAAGEAVAEPDLCGNCGNRENATTTTVIDWRTERLCDPCVTSYDWADWNLDPATNTYTHKTPVELAEARAARAGAEAADQVVTAQANAGMTPDRIEASAERVLGDRFETPTSESEAFYGSYDSTAAALVHDLRELDRPEPDRTPGAPHPDRFLADRGWQVSGDGIYVRRQQVPDDFSYMIAYDRQRQAEIEREAG
jgi:hypothetical protein